MNDAATMSAGLSSELRGNSPCSLTLYPHERSPASTKNSTLGGETRTVLDFHPTGANIAANRYCEDDHFRPRGDCDDE